MLLINMVLFFCYLWFFSKVIKNQTKKQCNNILQIALIME